MRSVHETEAVRLADSISKSQGHFPGTTGGKFPRLKLKFSQPAKESGSNGEKLEKPEKLETDEMTREIDAASADFLSPAVGFDERELSLPLEYLYRLLRRQTVWAEEETERLNQEWESIAEERKAAWKQKEAILEDVIHTELRAYKSPLRAEDFAIGNGAAGASGDTTIKAESSFRAGDTVGGSGILSHRNVDMGPVPPTERMEV